MHTTDSLDKYELYLKNSITKNLGLKNKQPKKHTLSLVFFVCLLFVCCLFFYQISETKISEEENIKVIKFLKNIFVSYIIKP